MLLLQLAPPASLISEQSLPPSSGSSMRRESGKAERIVVADTSGSELLGDFFSRENSIGAVAIVDDAERRLFSPEPAAHGEFGLAWLLLLLLPWRSNGSASAHATINVLLFLLRRSQNLQTSNRRKLRVHESGGTCALQRIVWPPLTYLKRT